MLKATKNNLKTSSSIKISADEIQRNAKPLFAEYPVFCFSHVTNNKDYTFDCFANDKHGELEARRALDGLLEYLSHNRWLVITQKRKNGLGGYESLPYQDLKFQPKDYAISCDEKVSVIRFGKQDAYRLIGKWKEPVFYIFGYDFNYNAYKH